MFIHLLVTSQNLTHLLIISIDFSRSIKSLQTYIIALQTSSLHPYHCFIFQHVNIYTFMYNPRQNFKLSGKIFIVSGNVFEVKTFPDNFKLNKFLFLIRKEKRSGSACISPKNAIISYFQVIWLRDYRAPPDLAARTICTRVLALGHIRGCSRALSAEAVA